MAKRVTAILSKANAEASDRSVKAGRSQKDRRDLDSKTHRFMVSKVYGVMSRQDVESKRADNRLIQERVHQAYETGEAERLGPSFARCGAASLDFRYVARILTHRDYA